MWEDLQSWGGELWETVGESVEVYAKSYADAKAKEQATTKQETARNPEVLTQLEPEKAQRTDGSTIVAPTATAQPPIINGVSNTALAVGGALVVGLLFVLSNNKG